MLENTQAEHVIREQAFVKISNENLERHTDKFTGKANECTCDSVSFFSSFSSCSVFCSLTFIISSSFSRLLFSCSVMPGFDSTVTAPTDLIGAEDTNIPFIFLEYSSWRLVTWDITYSWLTNDLAQQGHWNKEDEESSKKKGMRGNDREKWLAGKLLQVKESKRIMLWKRKIIKEDNWCSKAGRRG